MKFDKPAYTPDQHIELLESRGMTLVDHDRAKRYLTTIGYYRLSAYFLPFLAEKDQFKTDVKFSDILDLYIFDRKLRLHVMDALERIEVAIRSVLSDTLCVRFGPHWYMIEDVFKKSFIEPAESGGRSQYKTFISKIISHTGKKNHGSRNPSCKHYYEVYSEPELPPSWMVAEVLPMGTWSLVYENIAINKIRQKISKSFSFNTNDFSGWLHALTLIRNNCAHHGRFWNSTFPPKAKNIAKYTHKYIPIDTPYANLALIHAFLTSFTNQPTWSQKLFDLLQDCPLDINHNMKFPFDWDQFPFWCIHT
jgi:abortive infection bacteriophage resistance protein